MLIPLLPVKDKIGPALQASKWLTCSVLLDESEMKDLLDTLGEFWILIVSGLLQREEGAVSQNQFLEIYTSYVSELKQGRLPSESSIRPYFTSIWTNSLDMVYKVDLPDSKQVIKVTKPVIQLHHHKLDYSVTDGKFRSMVLGPTSVFWGLQFSYPQIYQDPSILKVEQVKEGTEFPNTSLFRRLQHWIRHHTAPTPFIVDEKRINVPIRLGKRCFEWINHHPQLAPKGLKVMTR